MTTKTETKDAPVLEAETVPQTKEEIAATEQALGLAPRASNGAPAAKVPVRMGVAPTNIDEAWRLAQFIATSELVPKGYRGRPADVLVAIQYGMEVGLPPMAALHSIYVTNGRPNLWGDGFLAVIMASPVYKDHHEYYLVDGAEKEFLVDADLKKDDTTAVCTFWRTDSARPRTATFSIAKAKKAGLWTKQGPWQEYPDRQLKMRARGFAGHDCFPDVLRGIRPAEEVIDLGPLTQTDPEPPREVRRISETPIERATNEGSIGTGKDRNVTTKPTELPPLTVIGVAQFMGGFTVTLADDQDRRHEVDVVDVADAAEFEKFVGTSHKVRLTVTSDKGRVLLQSWGIAE
jgi:hypothetical protein